MITNYNEQKTKMGPSSCPGPRLACRRASREGPRTEGSASGPPPPALASTAWQAARATGEDSGSGTCLVCLSQGTMSPSAPRSVLHSPGDAATQEQRAHSFCRHQAHGGPVSLQKLVSGQQGICYLVHRSPHLLSLQSRGTTHQAWAGKKDGRAAVHKRLCPQQQ